MNKLTLFLIFCLITGIMCGCSGRKCKKSSSKSSSSGCKGKGCGSSGSSSGGCCGGGGSSCDSNSMYGGAMSTSITPDYEAISLPSYVTSIGIMDSPYYDCKTNSLYFVDLLGSNIFRYSEELKQVFACSFSGAPSFILPIRQSCLSSSDNCSSGCGSGSSSGSSSGCSSGGCGSSSSGCSSGGCGSSSSSGCSGSMGGLNSMDQYFLVGIGNAVVKIQWDGMSSTSCPVIGTLTSAEQGHLINAAIAGPKGALYFGYLASKFCGEPASQGWYRWTRTDGITQLPGSFVTTNALAYDNANDILYRSDGCTKTILACDINRKTGEMSPCQTLIDNSVFGLPNNVAIVGLAISCEGNLYVDTYGTAQKMFVVSPNGQILQIINMPVPYTAATAWGGCNRDTLYVLSSGTALDIPTGTVISTNLTSTPPSGKLLAFRGLGRGQRGGSKRPCAC